MGRPEVPRVDELRPVTALFADIVNSTALAEHLPPEEVKAVVGECVNRMTIAVERFGGVVTAFMGDGIAAFFGVPTAREDDAERAAEAALAILHVAGVYTDEIRRAWGITDFDVRIGINSGQTATGVVGGREPVVSALGDVPNVAARLQAAAEPGHILVGESTAGLLAGRYRLEDAEEIAVKGRSAPVVARELFGRRERDEPVQKRALIAREAESRAIGEALAAVAAGRGGVVLITGDAGMGKSELILQTCDTEQDAGRLDGTREQAGLPPNATVLRGHNLSYSGAVLYQPFVHALRGWLGVSSTEPALAVRVKLRTRLERLFADPAEPFGALSSMLGIDDEIHPRSEDVEAAYVSFVQALAERGPVILIVDDFHWADSATISLGEAILGLTDSTALLWIIAMRTDAEPEARSFRLKVLDEYAHRTTEIRMQPLDEDDMRSLIDDLPGDSPDEGTLRDVISFAEGNPLYAQELMHALSDARPGEAARWTIARSKTLTPALQNLLVARLDRLPDEVRTVAQTAAILGRTFPAFLLEEMLGQDPSNEIRTLLRDGIVREVTRYPDLQYEFAQGLMREAALSTQTPATLKELYTLAGNALEKRSSDQGEENAELLAYYFYRSADQSLARPHLLRAASRARRLGAAGTEKQLLERAEKLAAGDGGTGDAGARVDP